MNKILGMGAVCLLGLCCLSSCASPSQQAVNQDLVDRIAKIDDNGKNMIVKDGGFIESKKKKLFTGRFQPKQTTIRLLEAIPIGELSRMKRLEPMSSRFCTNVESIRISR
jgi:acetylglutamate kinase